MLRINRNKVLSSIGDEGKTVTQFINDNGISCQTFYRVVMRGGNCSVKTAGKIARAIGLKVADILESDDKEA